MAVDRLSTVVRDSWTTAAAGEREAAAAGLGQVLFFGEDTERRSIEIVLEVAHTLSYLSLDPNGQMDAIVAARTRQEAAEAVARAREAFPKRVIEPRRVEIRFFSYAQHGPRANDETVDVCPWDEVAANYSARTRADLEPLMRGASLGGQGRAILWLGPPGTGKTHALRALAWQHRERVKILYVLDPDAFLKRADYVMALFRDSTDDDDGPSKDRLIVLEDAGELLGPDAPQRVGDGLSRLLNLTDGLPGQGTRTRILITTNEDIGRLHPAVTRPGRCGSVVRFSPLDEREARDWLHFAQRRATWRGERLGPTTIAEICLRSLVESPLQAPSLRAWASGEHHDLWCRKHPNLIVGDGTTCSPRLAVSKAAERGRGAQSALCIQVLLPGVAARNRAVASWTRSDGSYPRPDEPLSTL